MVQTEEHADPPSPRHHRRTFRRPPQRSNRQWLLTARSHLSRRRLPMGRRCCLRTRRRFHQRSCRSLRRRCRRQCRSDHVSRLGAVHRPKPLTLLLPLLLCSCWMRCVTGTDAPTLHPSTPAPCSGKYDAMQHAVYAQIQLLKVRSRLLQSVVQDSAHLLSTGPRCCTGHCTGELVHLSSNGARRGNAQGSTTGCCCCRG